VVWLQVLVIGQSWPLLTVLLILIVFVLAPMQATGFFALHAGAITILLALLAGMAMISKSKTAILMMALSLLVNIVVFVERHYYSWPYNLHVLAWLTIAATPGVVVTRAVFGPGHVTYRRIVGAVLVYPLVAVGFACVFTFSGLSIDGATRRP
jgi:hypothetical protein